MYTDDGICVSKSQEQRAVDTKIIADDLALASRFYSQQDKVKPFPPANWSVAWYNPRRYDWKVLCA